MDKLPTYEMVINPDETSDVEVSFVALVDKPAIEKNFIAFADQQLNFSVDPEQKIISGPAMVADSLIYRRDDQGEYNVFFSADTIKQIALKFFKKDYQKNLNLFHDPTLSLEGVTIFESFVSDKSRGIQPMAAFKDLPDGTWFISAKVENDIVWEKVKTGEVKGFSVEGIFSYLKKGQNGTVAQNSHFIETDFMADIKDLWNQFKEKFLGNPAAVVPVAASTDYTLQDGTTVSIDKLEAGGVVMVNGAPAPAGDYSLQDGTVLTVSDGGVIASVTAPVASAEPAAQSADYAPQFAAIDEKFTAYETKFTEQAGIIAGLQSLVAKQDEMLKGLFGIVDQLANAPAADPVGDPKSNFSTQKVDTKEEKRKQLAETMLALKNKK